MALNFDAVSRKGNRNSGHRLCIMVCPSFWEDYYMLIYTHCWELMNSVGSHGSSSLPFVMKVMVCHFVSDSHEVMTALIVVLPLIVVVEISLQLHGSLMWYPRSILGALTIMLSSQHLTLPWCLCSRWWVKGYFWVTLGCLGWVYFGEPFTYQGKGLNFRFRV